ncbi:hypothetical protein M2272_000293 [Mycobacterium frederiksbergense]|uniref:HNH nuclease domain-containing protein n=1 Tax=Mycolicibacterium frederiksbergense TaxID=117567 RepID=A0ABT6KSF6_9MYCO|nr:HNH endonuclease signature motif containing protein [Mycolicibacterium frederiksbergense]MDH6193672.1 hypothetical protein [Mycolicibacterium frederiksbergense]
MFALLDLPSLADAALIDALESKTRAEAVAAAERLAIIAEIVARHCDDEDDASAYMAIDGWETAAAAVGAACNLGRHAASAQMRIAQALRERLPKVTAVFQRGEISAKVISTITWRTQLVIDSDALALIDAALAGTAASYGTLSVDKAEQAIDVWVEKFDPAAVRRGRHGARSRDINFGDSDDPNGTVSIWGRLLATDGAILKKTLTEIAGSVCDADPRTMAQRRSDALGALAARAERLACLCGTADCPAAGADPRSSSVVIYLLTDKLPACTEEPGEDITPQGPDDEVPSPAENVGTATELVDITAESAGEEDVAHRGAQPTEESGENVAPPDPDDEVPGPAENVGTAPEPTGITAVPAGEGDIAHRGAQPTEAPRDHRVHGEYGNYLADSTPAVTGSPAVILGGGIVPAPLLAELIATGATVKPVADASALGAENRYRISAKLAAFVRLRDMRCMFPGCGVAAQHCDLDHAMPWPYGATHPGNLGPKCRSHHLLKTFPAADGGWADVQHPDGSHTWTAPTGHTYRTTPFGQILFPQWNTQTPPPPPAGPALKPRVTRDIKMPTRKRTRQQTRIQRINAERRLNEEGGKAPPY